MKPNELARRTARRLQTPPAYGPEFVPVGPDDGFFDAWLALVDATWPCVTARIETARRCLPERERELADLRAACGTSDRAVHLGYRVADWRKEIAVYDALAHLRAAVTQVDEAQAVDALAEAFSLPPTGDSANWLHTFSSHEECDCQALREVARFKRLFSLRLTMPDNREYWWRWQGKAL